MNLYDNLMSLLGHISSTQATLDTMKNQQIHVSDEIEKIKKRIEVRSESLEITRKIMSELSTEGVKVLERLIQDGLNIVFNDRQYQVRIMVEDKRGVKQMEFYLVEIIEGEEVISDIRSSVGGSIVTVVSLITQVFYINQMSGLPVLFIDEAFTDLSRDYLENLFRLLQLFKEKLKFSYLLITHMSEVLPYVDCVYELKDGVSSKVHG